MRKRLVLALSVVLSGCGSDTHAPLLETPVPTAGAPAAHADWRAAEAGITAAEMRKHVELLASDELRGRETFTDGARQAAEYLAARFAADGLEKLPGQGSYLVEYTLDELGWDPAGTTLSWRRGKVDKHLQPGVDFQPLDSSDEGKTVAGEVVFAGYGLHLPKKGWDDFAGLDVAGKVVLVLRHTPHEKEQRAKAEAREGGGKPEADETQMTPMDGAFAAKAAYARELGAVGMLVVTDPSHEFDEPMTLVARREVPASPEEKAKRDKQRAERAAKLKARRAKALAVSASSARPRGAGKRSDVFVSAMMTRAAAEELLAGSGTTLAALQQAVDGGKKPKALRLGKVRASLSAKATATPRKVTAANVVGFLPGSDPARRDQWVVVGGHYDHIGEGGLDGDRINNGADDNASGTSGVLEIAQAFASLSPEARPARSLVFASFSAEEMGLLGSEALLAEHDLPVERVVFMLNLDMIGRNPEKKIEILGDAYATGVKEVTEKANAGLDVDFAWSGPSYSPASDHHSFFTRHVPMMFFFTGTHPDYHQPGDHADKLAYDRMEKLARLGFRIAGGVASAPEPPRFILQLPWLGAAVAVVDGAVTVTTLAPGLRGAAAGLSVGDALVSIAARPIATTLAVEAAFAEVEPGAAAHVVVRRKGQQVALEVRRVKPGFLGITQGDLPDDERKRLGLGEGEGLLISSVVPDGPAAKSGMKPGDVLVRLGDQAVSDQSLFLRLSTLGAGERVTAVVVRGAERVSLDLTIGERP